MGKQSDLEAALTRWYVMTRAHNIPVTNALLKSKAKSFSVKIGCVGFKPSKKWFTSWKKSNGIVNQTRDQQTNKPKLNNHDSILSQNVMSKLITDYKPSDIYAFKEISLKCDVLPHEVLSQVMSDNFVDRLQLTVVFAVNQCGLDKRQLVVVGEQKLRSGPSSLPCEYHTEPHSWMTSNIFVDWLMEFNFDLKKQKRYIALILDESPIHPKEAQKDLSNIKLFFVNPNSKPNRNPCDFGISYSLKALYRKEFSMRRILECEQEMSQMDIFHMLNKAWFLLSSKTITDSFYKAGFHDKSESSPDMEQEEIIIEELSPEDVVKYVEFDKSLMCFGLPSDDIICGKFPSRGLENKETSSVKDSKVVGVTEDDALRVLATLRRFYETNEMLDFSSFYALETQVLESINRKDT